MLPQHSRAQLVKTFGEQAAQSFEDLLTRISEAADNAGIEKKEKKNSLAAEFADMVIKAVAEVNKPPAKATGEDSDFIKELKSRISFTQTKDIKATAPAGPLFADGRVGLANLLHKESSGDSLDLARLRQMSKNKQEWGIN